MKTITYNLSINYMLGLPNYSLICNFLLQNEKSPLNSLTCYNDSNKPLRNLYANWNVVLKMKRLGDVLTMVVDQCKVNEALGILVGKWKPVILLTLLSEGTLRFSELRRLMPDVTQKMLTKQLRELEDEDIITRVVYPQVPPKVEYSISPYGKSLRPVLDAMHEWGTTHATHISKLRAEDSQQKVL